MSPRNEVRLALVGLVLGAIGFQVDLKPMEFAGLIFAAVAFGLLLSRSGSSF